jgi:N6-adenosine-specific RNA methylase IME4
MASSLHIQTQSENHTMISNAKGVVLTKPRFISRKRYDTVVIDPPWPIVWKANEFTGNKGLPYEPMSVQQICDLPISDLLNKPAWVFLWTTCSLLHEAFHVLDAWGFQYRQTITWVKDYGMGRPPYTATEHCLMAAYGAPERPHMYGTQLLNHFSTKGTRLAHSTKPDKFFDHIKPFSNGNCLEMFSRSERAGWDHWGINNKQP